MMQRTRALLLFCLISIPFFTTQAWAFCDEVDYDGAWYLSLGAGRSLYKMDTDNFINPGPGWPDDHYYKNSIHDASFVDIGLGYSIKRNTQWFPLIMLGLDYQYGFQGKVSGYVNQYNLGQFQNYTYSYDFSRQTLLALLKADIFQYNCFLPYITVGTGPSFNKGSSYEELPLTNVTARVSPGYGTGTNTSWSYVIGVGVDYPLRDDILLSLEYNYGDFGEVKTGHGQPTPTVTGVNYTDVNLENTLKANTFLFRLTYLMTCI